MKARRLQTNWLQELMVVVPFALCILIGTAVAGAVPASQPAGGSAAEFRHDDSAVDHKLGVSLLVSFGIIALGAAAVVWGRRKAASTSSTDARGHIKVLEVKRITRAITVVSVETADGRNIVFADNNQSLLLLSADSGLASLDKHEVTSP